MGGQTPRAKRGPSAVCRCLPVARQFIRWHRMCGGGFCRQAHRAAGKRGHVGHAAGNWGWCEAWSSAPVNLTVANRPAAVPAVANRFTRETPLAHTVTLRRHSADPCSPATVMCRENRTATTRKPATVQNVPNPSTAVMAPVPLGPGPWWRRRSRAAVS